MFRVILVQSHIALSGLAFSEFVLKKNFLRKKKTKTGYGCDAMHHNHTEPASGKAFAARYGSVPTMRQTWVSRNRCTRFHEMV